VTLLAVPVGQTVDADQGRSTDRSNSAGNTNPNNFASLAEWHSLSTHHKRLQVNARFTRLDPLDLTDSLEDFGEPVQRGGVHFGQEIPSSVGVVQGGQCGLTQQGSHDFPGAIAFHGDTHPRPDFLRAGFRPQPDRVADDQPGFLQS
jgi:hypothetical protein